MKELIIIPQGGLCNRLRVVLSSLTVARQATDYRIRVEWGIGRECHAAFNDLFQPIIEEKFNIAPRKWWNTPQSWHNLHIPTFLRHFIYSKQYPLYNYKTNCTIEQLMERYPKVYLSTWLAVDATEVNAEILHPVEALQQRIDSLTAFFSEDTVGVHIRRTDNAQAIATSTMEAFCQALDSELAQHPYTNFFLATDDRAVKEYLQQKYPGRILIQGPSIMRRDTLSGMREAVVDLYCLSKTQKVLGSYYSSFSATAAEIGNIPLITVGVPNNKP